MANSNNSNRSRFVWLHGSFRFVVYWFSLISQPVIAIVFIVGLAWLFGYMQRNHNWFNFAESAVATSKQEEDVQYACSMLCVFVKAPGRCPVCGMELQKIETQGDPKDIYGITIDPTARRLANIETVAALTSPISREIEALEQVTYDETTEATISSYTDGRVENLFVDFTGARIRKGDEVAVLYSPDLYADQVGLLQAKKALQNISGSDRVNQSNQRLYQSARRRLIELGLPASKVDQIEEAGEPSSRIKIHSPMSGTVVDKLVEEGKYIKTGMPILKIADLSSVWLKLAMYPEDTSRLRIGQSVFVEIQSQVGTIFEGKVAFVDPMVDAKTQTVNVRVEIPNESGLIKIGDFGKARILTGDDRSKQFVVVPREAVLINGPNSIAYVETEPGRFEFRKVKVAETLGEKISISEGIEPGEQVVASGAFMLDSTFNIQGKVSLIDPNRAATEDYSQLAKDKAEAKEIEESFADLSTDDRALAEAQVICPVTEVKLGTLGMGAPIRIKFADRDVMICCAGCEENLRKDIKKYYAILDAYHSDKPSTEELKEIEKSFAPLSAADRDLAETQVICPVSEVRLGTMGMGTPINVDVNGSPIMICCEGCRKPLLENPEKYIEILKHYKAGKQRYSDAKIKTNAGSKTDVDLPQMQLPATDLPQMELPKLEIPE